MDFSAGAPTEHKALRHDGKIGQKPHLEAKGRINVQTPTYQIVSRQAIEIRALRAQSAKHKDIIDNLVREIDKLTVQLDLHEQPIRIQQLEQQHEEDVTRIAQLKRVNLRLRCMVDDTREEIGILQQNLKTEQLFLSVDRLDQSYSRSRSHRRYKRRIREIMGTEYETSSDEDSEPSIESTNQSSEEEYCCSTKRAGFPYNTRSELVLFSSLLTLVTMSPQSSECTIAVGTRRSSRISQAQSEPATPQATKPVLPIKSGGKSKVENKDQINKADNKDQIKKSDGFPPSIINPKISKRKADDAELVIATLRKDVRQLNRDVDRLQGDSWDQAGIIQELKDTIIALNELQNDQDTEIADSAKEIAQLKKTAARLQALLNDTQTELQTLRTDLEPEGLCSSLDRLATAYTASQAGSDDEGDDDARSVELCSSPNSLLSHLLHCFHVDTMTNTNLDLLIGIFHAVHSMVVAAPVFLMPFKGRPTVEITPSLMSLDNAPRRSDRTRILTPKMQIHMASKDSSPARIGDAEEESLWNHFDAGNNVGLDWDDVSKVIDAASLVVPAPVPKASTGSAKKGSPRRVFADRSRKIRELQAENIRLASRAQEFEGQVWEATNFVKHQTTQIDSLTNMNLATAAMVVKLREEIWVLRQDLNQEDMAKSMVRMDDLYAHPDNHQIGLHLMAAVHKIEAAASNSSSDDEEHWQVEKIALPRGGSTSPLSSW
ncbi:hypothetical protein C8J56DRAFT_886766 [Mycena floridula]|nr:hypothetical protein C8J56DRAFT_886766 [Mycena floridula]